MEVSFFQIFNLWSESDHRCSSRVKDKYELSMENVKIILIRYYKEIGIPNGYKKSKLSNEKKN